MMQRAFLNKIGQPILTVYEPDGSEIIDYCFVAYVGDLIGVAIFHNRNKDCTLALIRDVNGDKVILGHFAENYPLDPIQFIALDEIYSRNFTY